MKKALITGINGQDGSYLSELLLEKGYDVYGIVKTDSATRSQLRLTDPVRGELTLVAADINDPGSLTRVMREVRPDEVYNLASQSRIDLSFEQPLLTVQTNAVGAMNVMDAVRLEIPTARIYQASSSEMFGNGIETDGFQRETTIMDPASPYACSKLFAYLLAGNYREAYALFISNGILFNHESPRRGTNFVTTKICKEAVRIKYGLSDKLELGNVDARRDWGHAKDYVRAMWMILQHDEPDDFVCATGTTHSVRDVVKYVFERLELDWSGVMEVSPQLLRPEDGRTPKGDSTKIRKTLGWEPQYTFETMLDEMIDHWLVELKPTGR